MIWNFPNDKKFLRTLHNKPNIKNEWKEGRFKRVEKEVHEPNKSNLTTILENQTRILASLVPDEILEKVDDYNIRSYDAVFLFGDVSGFTELSVRYNVHGKGGPSKLTQMLNSYMGAMVQEVLSHNGDILKFSGDAFFCMWKTDEKYSLRDIVHDAVDCAIFIQRRCGTYLTDVGVTLRVKIAIAAGPVVFSIIGNEHFSHYVVLGSPIADVKNAEEHASSGEILVSQSVWDYASVSEYIVTDMLDGKHYKVTGFSSKWKSSARRRNQQEVISIKEDRIFSLVSSTISDDSNTASSSSSNDTDHLPFTVSKFYQDEIEGFTLRPTVDIAVKNNLREKLRRFLIPPVLRGIELNEPLDFLTEVRYVVILFINIIIKENVMEKFVNLIKVSFDVIFRIVNEEKGCVNKVSLFDKDYMILCIFGLRGMKGNQESQVALHCGHSIRKNLIEYPEIQSVSCAVTTGLTYCGVVGHVLRREYTVISLTVNKAARFMVAYPDKVTCDRETFLHSKLEAKAFVLQKHIKLKGLIELEPVYEYREDKITSGEKRKENIYPLLDREYEINLYSDLLNRFISRKELKDSHGVDSVNTFVGIIINGELKQGKTSLLNEMLFHTPSSIPVRHFYLLSKDFQVPFATIRYIFGLTVDFIEEQDRDKRQLKLIKYLRNSNMNEVYCALNDIFQVHFEYTDEYKKLTQRERLKVKRNLFEHLVRSYFPTVWVFAVDHAENIDDKSWILLNFLFKVERCFTILTTGLQSISETGTKIIKRLQLKTITLRPISKWYHAALACQILNVRAIPVELERIIQNRSNGNPGWVKNYLITLNQMKAILIQSVPKKDVEDLGLVVPPNTMLSRKQTPPQINDNPLNQSISCDLNENWKLLQQCVLDSEADFRHDFSDYSNESFEPVDIQICRLAPDFNADDFNSEYNVMNALIMKTFDSLSLYEQHLVKGSSILGERFLRSMLLYVLLIPATAHQTAVAVKNLFDIKVLTCAGGKFTEDLRLILDPTMRDDLRENTQEICQCQGFKYDASCKDLPKYSQCGYMKFESHLFQQTISSLLTDHQKKEFHGRAIRFLENKTRRCKICGSGIFHRFDGISRYQIGHWNPSQLAFSVDQMQSENLSLTTSMAPFVSETSSRSRHSFDGIKSSYLIFDPISYEKSRKNSIVHTVKIYKIVKGSCCKNKKPNVKKCHVSELPKFEKKNLEMCTCNLILNWAYTKLLLHLRGAGRYDKLLECQLDYAQFCINNSNIPMAFKLLDDANTLLQTQTIYDEYNTFATWLIPVHIGRIHMLTGYAKLQLQESNAALESLYTAMSYFGHPFPKTAIGLQFSLKKQQYRQKLFLRFPEKFIHNKTGKYGEFCGILSDCLGILYQLFREMSKWNYAKLAGIWCLNEALAGPLSFRCMCNAYGIMIEVCTHFDKPIDLFEMLAIDLCQRQKYLIETDEFPSIIMLYYSILINRFVKGKLYDSKEIGYVTLNLACKLQDLHTINKTYQVLIDVLTTLNKFSEIIQHIMKLYHHSKDCCDEPQRGAYHFNCIYFALNTGYSIIDLTQCEQFCKLECGPIDHFYLSDCEKRFYVAIWLWYVRHSNWDGAELYNPKIIIDSSERRHSILGHWLRLLFVEGLIITLVHNIDMHYIEKVLQLKHQIDDIMKDMQNIIKKKLSLGPRYYHLKVYYLKVVYGNPKLEELLNTAKQAALNVNNLYEHGYIIHNELYWSNKMAPELVDQWKHSTSAIWMFQDLQVLLENNSNIIYYTFPLPCEPISI